jgi:murein DD-endopeptidase MepM/ murein hydrolase activator NlpD
VKDIAGKYGLTITATIMKRTLNIILFTDRIGEVRSYEINPQRAMQLALLLLIALGGAILYGGFRLGATVEASGQLAEVGALQDLARQQQAAIDSARDTARDNLDALTLRLGRMQAQMLRLDALGERLVGQADLDAAEFDFDITPPVGGPHDATALTTTSVPDFLDMLDELDVTMADRQYKLAALEQLIRHRQLRERVMPSGDAVRNGHLSSRYGTRIDPFSGKQEQHKGIDIAGKEGSDVLALGDGIVIWSGKRSGYGNLIEVDHGNGYVTRYAHNRELLAQAGDTVRKGQPVALMGSTGRSTGPHVHIEVLRDGKQVNPTKYLGTS